MGTVTVTWEGIDACVAALDGIMERVREATRSGVEEGGQMVTVQARGNIAANFVVQTGALAASTFSRMSGEYEATIAPHIVYGRIQELGGTVFGRPWLAFPAVHGPNEKVSQRAMAAHGEKWNEREYVVVHSVTLHGRPYLAPALESETIPWYNVMIEKWAAAWAG